MSASKHKSVPLYIDIANELQLARMKIHRLEVELRNVKENRDLVMGRLVTFAFCAGVVVSMILAVVIHNG